MHKTIPVIEAQLREAFTILRQSCTKPFLLQIFTLCFLYKQQQQLHPSPYVWALLYRTLLFFLVASEIAMLLLPG